MESNSVKEYLKRYEGNLGGGTRITEKKRTMQKKNTGLVLVDEDPVWQRPVVDDEVKSSSRKRSLSNPSPSHSHRPSRDVSPPRKGQKKVDVPLSVRNQKTGLISARDIREEIDRKKKEVWLRFEQMDPSISGRGAEPVCRDRIEGRRISMEEYLRSKQKPKEIKDIEWSKGLAEKREAEARVKELELEKNRPIACTRDDAELNSMLKERVRRGDPMAHLIKKKYPKQVIPNSIK